MSTAPKLHRIEVRAVRTAGELRLANDLMAKSHRPNYFNASQWFETCGAGYPGFLREHTRIALIGNEIAGALRLNTDTIRLGESRLKMGGLGWVTTAPRYRNSGVCTRLMEDALRYMREHRYHVSMLFGIPNFYHRFGYATTLADYAVTVDALELANVRGTGLRVRNAKPGDIPAIQKIHAANDSGVACSLLRSAAHLTNGWENFQRARVFTTARGKVVGYLSSREDRTQLLVREAGVIDPRTYADVLQLCAALAHEYCVGQIQFSIPPDDALARQLLAFKSTHETRFVREEGGMMRFVDLGEALESLIAEWEDLLTRSALLDAQCEVTLLVGGEPYRIRAHRGAIDIAQQSGRNKFSVTAEELIQLATGYAYIDGVLLAKRRLLTEEARRLLRALFPKRNPYVWTCDRF